MEEVSYEVRRTYTVFRKPGDTTAREQGFGQLITKSDCAQEF